MNALAVVTGGTRGIGKAITTLLLENGFEVYFTYKSNQAESDALTNKFPDQARGFKIDSNNWDDIKKFAERVIQEKSPSILINNVGYNKDEIFINQELEKFWDVLTLNLGSTICYCKSFINAMLRQRNGQIINISSVAAIKPKIGNSAYGASKAAIERFSKTLALEVARFNVRVNCISPAYVDTDLLSNYFATNSINKVEFLKDIPMRKILDPKEVASAVLALCKGEINTTGSIFYLGNGENIVS